MITMFFISVINQLYKLRQSLLVSKIIFRNFIVIDLLHGTFKRPRGIACLVLLTLHAFTPHSKNRFHFGSHQVDYFLLLIQIAVK
jgi:hypothetical protein